MNDILEDCRELVARERARRGFFPSLLSCSTCPSVDDEDALPVLPDPLRRVLRDQSLLFARGKVFWGRLVMSNADLFRMGPRDLPAAVVYSDEPYFDEHLEELEQTAEMLFSLKSAQEVDPELADLARIVKNETDRGFNIVIPTSRTSGRRIYFTVTMVFRDHLPGRRLLSPWFPYLALPTRTELSLILPHFYWPDEFRAVWLETDEP